MRLQFILFISLLSGCGYTYAQQDSLVIPEVVVTDALFRSYSDSWRVIDLPDSVLQRDPGSATRLLQFHTPIYFKENGLGMVSSPSFRGTTAQQTAVVWNGINLNSQLNGQTDFNAIQFGGYLAVRPGGGSVLFGSSAIGGSVHYNSALKLNSPLRQSLRFQYGSFNTVNASYGISAGLGKIGFHVNMFRNNSDNDFQWPNGRENLNGQFYNTGFDAAAGLKINAVHCLRFYSRLFDGQRHFALIVPSETKTKYRDINTSNMIEWVSRYSSVIATAKLAFLSENYQYYANLTAQPQEGNAETVVSRYDAAWRVSTRWTVHPVAEFSSVRGWGSNIRENRRDVFSGSVLTKFKALESLRFEGGIRKEVTMDYDSPVLFSGAAIFQKSGYTIRVNGSRNFRIPSFNDLYWATGGNSSLVPESSWQAEMGHQLILGPFEVSVTAYATNIQDMIQWLPGESTEWQVQNVHEIHVRGLEAFVKFDRRIGLHHLQLSGTYSYTDSENRKTGAQLIFVPYHKGTCLATYSFNRFELSAETLFTGEVFTRSDNNARYNLEGYAIVNGGLALVLDRRLKSKIGINVRNVGNSQYMTQPRRPYPGRHYAINLIFNF